MKKLNQWVVLALGLGALALAFLLGSEPRVGAAPQPPGPTSVIVDNQPNDPVPVAIMNKPTVRVEPTIPLQIYETDGVIDVNFVEVQFLRTQPIKLEHVSAWIEVPTGQRLTEVYLFGFVQGEQVRHWLTPTRIATAAALASVSDIYQVSQALPAYYDGDFSLYVLRDVAAGALRVEASLVGALP